MANIKSAAKRAKQTEKRRRHNIALKSRMRTAVKSVHKAIVSGDAERASDLYRSAVPEIDRAAGKGLIHPNKAARHKSRLSRSIRALQA